MCLLLLETLTLLHFIFLGAPWFRFSEMIKYISCNVNEIFWSSLSVPQACVQLKVGVWDLAGCFCMVHLFYAIYWAACVSFSLTVIAFCTLNFMLQASIQCIKAGNLRGKHIFKSKNKIIFLTVNKHRSTYAYFPVDWATWVLIKVGSKFSRKKGIVWVCVCA